MALLTIYSPEGVAEEREPVDARECVEHCGYCYEPPAPADPNNPLSEDGQPSAGAPAEAVKTEAKSGGGKK